jgi:hypothetical protein
MDLKDVVEEHSILFKFYVRAVSVAKTKQLKYHAREIIYFNVSRDKIFVLTILKAPHLHGQILVERDDSNISGLNMGKAIWILGLPLVVLGSFKLEELVDTGLPNNAVNDKLID